MHPQLYLTNHDFNDFSSESAGYQLLANKVLGSETVANYCKSLEIRCL